jgi:hypothetical protein
MSRPTLSSRSLLFIREDSLARAKGEKKVLRHRGNFKSWAFKFRAPSQCQRLIAQAWRFAVSEEEVHFSNSRKEKNRNFALPSVGYEGIIPCAASFRMKRNFTQSTQNSCLPLKGLSETQCIVLYLYHLRWWELE